ncbi:MerR family transcriptional regulator [Lacisediminihabitans sp.]|uniref:MerR family transcriptional regulator n=1 Tax=Lacisediminihabitans sp. TaxID=2787631 RepID=UPI00374DC984
MAELSTTSGIPTATIKFYLREGLLPAGVRTGPTQAQYDESHLQRLRLIRALLDVGELSVTAARGVIASIDSDDPLLHTFDLAQQSVSQVLDPAEVGDDALDQIDAVLDGWRVSPGNPGRIAAARVLKVFGELGEPAMRGWHARYAEAALLVAAADLDEIDARDDREAKAQMVVVGTVLGDALFSGLRRAAQEHISSERYPAPSPTTAGHSKE